MSDNQRPRLRDLGISVGTFAPGPHNAITDVSGVRVGHRTLIEGSGERRRGYGPIRTGVTAILPNHGDIFMDRLMGGAFILNGAGELSGLIQVQEWGLLETPILLTNTLSVGSAAQGAVRWITENHPTIGDEHDVIIPLVGECDDSFLNDIAGHHVHPQHAIDALEAARSGPVEEGSVGGGTGMVAFDLKGGIGTSSRVMPPESGGYTLGVLVMSNVGRLEDLRVDGVPVGRHLDQRLADAPRRPGIYGSIIVVMATDAPLLSSQISRICKRTALGLGRVGSYAAHGSGEIVVGFSTANILPRDRNKHVYNIQVLSDRRLNVLYQAAIECTEEAVLNALCAADTMDGVDGHFANGLPLDDLVEIWQRHRGF